MSKAVYYQYFWRELLHKVPFISTTYVSTRDSKDLVFLFHGKYIILPGHFFSHS